MLAGAVLSDAGASDNHDGSPEKGMQRRGPGIIGRA